MFRWPNCLLGRPQTSWLYFGRIQGTRRTHHRESTLNPPEWYVSVKKDSDQVSIKQINREKMLTIMQTYAMVWPVTAVRWCNLALQGRPFFATSGFKAKLGLVNICLKTYENINILTCIKMKHTLGSRYPLKSPARSSSTSGFAPRG